MSSSLPLDQYVLDLMNYERSKVSGLLSYPRDGILDAAAFAHSALWLTVGSCPATTIGMVKWGDGHICPGEPDPCTRISNALGGVPLIRCAENVGEGYDLSSPSPNFYGVILTIHQQFMSEGPGGGFNHYDNIMSPIFDRVGIGFIINAGSIRFTVDFAKA